MLMIGNNNKHLLVINKLWMVMTHELITSGSQSEMITMCMFSKCLAQNVSEHVTCSL